MSDKPIQRRLAAVLAADIAGYTRLMEQDTDATVAAWRDARAKVIDPQIAARSGRIVKLTGDGFLAEFTTAQDAVSCAIAMQEGLARSLLDFRMGVNLGDIIDDGEDIHGEGVNVAARLEGLAEPGGIYISGMVFETVRNRIDADFEDLGEQIVKHVSSPVRVFRVGATGTGGRLTPMASTGPAPPDKPSIAVLPFRNMSTDPDMEYFADGIAQDIITALSKISGMRVIARNSTFAYKRQASDVREVAETLGVRYVLEGSIRHGGKRLRISARLVEVDTGSHVWAEQFDRVVDDLFDIQDEITKEVVTALRVQLTDGEQALVWARGTNDIEAWRCCVRATELFLQFHSSKYLEARILAERAVARDPNYAHAWAVLGFTHWWDGRLGFTGESEEKFDKAKQIADRAASLDDTVSWVIGLQTMVCSALGLYDESVALGERGIQHHPGNADVRAFLASVLTFADRPKEAIEHIRAAIALNPISPSWYLMVLSRSLAVLEEFEDALVSVDRLLSIEPLNVQALLLRTVILVRHGREMEARDAMKEVRKVAPPLRIHHLRNLFLTKNESALLFFSTALRNAGLPE